MQQEEEQRSISEWAKFGLWLVPWLVVLLIFGPGNIAWIWLFPVGLLGFLVPNSFELLFFILPILGWILYALFTAAALDARRWRTYFVLFLILCLLLCLNLAGCHA